MLIAPSVLSLDYSKFNTQLDILNKNADWLHFDVMDGHFVPNLTFGPDILKAFRKNTSLFIDTHLMVTDPLFFSKVFIDAGSDLITFHLECFDNPLKIKETIDYIHSRYVKCGISIKNDTPVESLLPYLKDIDLVLIMSIEPGFGGQTFMESAHSRIQKLNQIRNENNFNFLIEVDGGVNDLNAHDLKVDGCDVLVAGSFVFKDIERNISILKNI